MGASESNSTSKIACVEILKHQFHDFPANFMFSDMDFLDDPAAIHGCRLIISRSMQDAGPNELTNPEILMINRPRSPHSFTMILPAIFPDHDISSWAPGRQFCLVQRPPGMKSVTFTSSPQTLAHLNLSHMDSLDDPAAIT